MSLFNVINVFSLTVTDSTGLAAADALVVITNSSGVDVTALVAGINPARLNADGKLLKLDLMSVTPTVPAGVYTITVTWADYPTQSITTNNLFTGVGTFTMVLSRVITAPAHTITAPPTYASTYAPIPLTVNFTGATKPDILELTISHIDGRSSIMRLGVNKQTGIVTAYLQSRIRLAPTPVFVPSADVATVDPYFSDRVTVDMAVYFGTDRIELPTPVVFLAANLYPPVAGNNLIDFATGGTGGFIRWICPQETPRITPGYYYDAMIWLLPLDEAPGGSYLLKRNYYLGDGTTLVTAESDEVEPNLQIQRVSIHRMGNTAIKRATFYVTDDLGTRVSQYLNIIFNA